MIGIHISSIHFKQAKSQRWVSDAAAFVDLKTFFFHIYIFFTQGLEGKVL